MSAIESFRALAERYPQASPKVTEFPSGAAMLDLVIGGVHYCAEYLPTLRAYGLSKVVDASPFAEGFEHSFASQDQLGDYIAMLLGTDQ